MVVSHGFALIRASRAKDVVERAAIQQRQGGIVLGGTIVGGTDLSWPLKVRVQKTLKLGDNLPLFRGTNFNQLTTWLIIVIAQLIIP